MPVGLVVDSNPSHLFLRARLPPAPPRQPLPPHPSKWALVLFLPVVFHCYVVCACPPGTIGSCQNKPTNAKQEK